MLPRPDEDVLRGDWLVDGERVVADATCERIHWLVHNHLVPLANDPSGWETLFKDPADGRLWIRTYPNSEMHGGGPPTLMTISREAWDSRIKRHPA
jgi:immunity protein 27 of polymorphic toxin system